MSMFKWEVVDPAPGEAVAPQQRLAWGKTVGIGAQHVVAMFGATFVFPLIMGLNANLAIMMSGIATICFLLIVQGKVPSYLGHLGVASSVAPPRSTPTAEVTDRADPRTSPARSWSPVWSWRSVGVVIHFLGADVGQQGAAAGRHRRRRHADRLQPGSRSPPRLYMPSDRWMAIITMTAVILMAVGLRGFARTHRGLPRPDLRLPAVGAVGRDLRQDVAAAAGNPEPGLTTASTGTWSRTPTGSASRRTPRTGWSATRPFRPGYADVGWHLPVVLDHLHPAGAARR